MVALHIVVWLVRTRRAEKIATKRSEEQASAVVGALAIHLLQLFSSKESYNYGNGTSYSPPTYNYGRRYPSTLVGGHQLFTFYN